MASHTRAGLDHLGFGMKGACIRIGAEDDNNCIAMLTTFKLAQDMKAIH